MVLLDEWWTVLNCLTQTKCPNRCRSSKGWFYHFARCLLLPVAVVVPSDPLPPSSRPWSSPDRQFWNPDRHNSFIYILSRHHHRLVAEHHHGDYLDAEEEEIVVIKKRNPVNPTCQKRYVLFVAVHLHGEKSGNDVGMKWRVVPKAAIRNGVLGSRLLKYSFEGFNAALIGYCWCNVRVRYISTPMIEWKEIWFNLPWKSLFIRLDDHYLRWTSSIHVKVEEDTHDDLSQWMQQ